MGQRAAILANKGLAVFPVFTIERGACSCGRAGCSSPGKHPIGSLVPHGVSEATTDPAAIREWWAVYPDANIGIATGDVSGVMVLDIDVRSGGEESIANLEERYGTLPETWAVETGSGGVHFYYRMPGGADVRNSVGAVGPGIDVRGNGGYVVAPPSLHLSGHRYRWSDDLHPKRTPLAEPPPWLVERLAPSGGNAVSAPLPSKISEGYRNTWLASAAGTMRRRGFCEAAIYAALAVENKGRCVPPLEDREVRRIARSIERYPPERELRHRFHKTA